MCEAQQSIYTTHRCLLLLLLPAYHVLHRACCCYYSAEGGSSGNGGEGGGKMPDMNVSANLMLATTLMGAVFVYQVCCHILGYKQKMTTAITGGA
jgi:hypothetical protein